MCRRRDRALANTSADRMDADVKEGRSLDAALVMTEELGHVIRHADTKASLLLTAQAAVIAPLTRFVGPHIETGVLRGGEWHGALFALPLLLATLVLGCAGLVVLPRTAGAQTGNRFAWPQLKTMGDEALHVPPTALEAWQHARVLASICQGKFDWVRLALMFAAAEVVCVSVAAAVLTAFD